MKTHTKSEQYVRIVASLHERPVVLTLPHPAFRLWFDLRAQFTGGNNGRLMITPSIMRRRGWTSHSTAERACAVLLERGLIKRTRYCGRNTFHRASLYALTDLDVCASEKDGIRGSPATHDYLKWTAPTNERSGVPRSPSQGKERPREKGTRLPAREGTDGENLPSTRESERQEKHVQAVNGKAQVAAFLGLASVPREKGIFNSFTRVEAEEDDVAARTGVVAATVQLGHAGAVRSRNRRDRKVRAPMASAATGSYIGPEFERARRRQAKREQRARVKSAH